LKIHLLPIDLLPGSKFINSQVWLFRMDSFLPFTVSFHIYATRVDITFLNIWGSLLTAYAMKSGPKDSKIFDLLFLLGSTSASTVGLLGFHPWTLFHAFFPEVLFSSYSYKKTSSKNTTSLDKIITFTWISGISNLCTKKLYALLF